MNAATIALIPATLAPASTCARISVANYRTIVAELEAAQPATSRRARALNHLAARTSKALCLAIDTAYNRDQEKRGEALEALLERLDVCRSALIATATR